MSRLISVSCIAACFTVLSASAWADAVVEVRGSARTAFEPNVVRVRWRVYAHGKSASSAIKKLTACRAELDKQLAGLDGAAPIARLGDAVEYTKAESGFAAIQGRALAIAMGGGGGNDDNQKTRIRMAFPVTLEWPLTGATPAERNKAVDKIRDQLRALGALQGTTDDDDDDDDGDVDDEDNEDEKDDDDDEQDSPAPKIKIEDGPTFYFIRRLTDEEAAGVAALAFKDAERRAGRFAAAAGRGLGTLIRISDSISMGQMMDQMQQASVMMSQMFGDSRPTFDDDADRPETELVSPKLKPVRYEVKMTVEFKLK